MGEWISVNDRLPEKRCRCLVVNWGYICTAEWFTDLSVFRLSRECGFVNDDRSDDVYLLGCVTHWMPLPELPTEIDRS